MNRKQNKELRRDHIKIEFDLLYYIYFYPKYSKIKLMQKTNINCEMAKIYLGELLELFYIKVKRNKNKIHYSITPMGINRLLLLSEVFYDGDLIIKIKKMREKNENYNIFQ